MPNAHMRVSEIFRSLQGEGRHQGRVCAFVRLTGCNLACAWCDTLYAREGGDLLTTPEVSDRVLALGCSHVCITGGEPLLQMDEVLALVKDLHAHGLSIEIETNGTIDFSPLQRYAAVCMDVKCPSSGEKSDLSLLQKISPHDSVKFVVADPEDCEYAREVIAAHEVRGEIFISPVYGTDYRQVAEFVISTSLPVRFQLQLHRIIGVR